MPDANELLDQAECLLDARSLDAAMERFDAAAAGGASADRCAAGRWMGWMLRGDFEQAWRESDGIRERAAPDPHRFWNGEDIRGKSVVLRCLHGFGDAVQMLRFAPRLQSCCGQLVVEVPPRLLELAALFEGVDRVITWGALAPAAAPVWDIQVEIMELPYLFRITRYELPGASRYLRLPTGVRERVGAMLTTKAKPKVGLVWAAGEWNPSRGLPLDMVARIMRVSGCEFWNLQGGRERERWRELPSAKEHRDAAECGDGIVTLAAVIDQLDLVITVDTLAAHLAGALGKPAWLLLQSAADWRWMTGRNDTPWYPSVRLYRQHAPGDWASVVRRVETDLARWVRREHHLELAG